jgi:hypothetical protein
MFASFGVTNTPISCLLFGFFIFILSDASFVLNLLLENHPYV